MSVTFKVADLNAKATEIAAPICKAEKAGTEAWIEAGQNVEEVVADHRAGCTSKKKGKKGTAEINKSVVKYRKAMWAAVALACGKSSSYIEQAWKVAKCEYLRKLVPTVQPTKKSKTGKADWTAGTAEYIALLVCVEKQSDGTYARKECVTEAGIKAALRLRTNGKANIEQFKAACRKLANPELVTVLPPEAGKKSVSFDATANAGGGEPAVSTAENGLTEENCKRYLAQLAAKRIADGTPAAKTAAHGQAKWHIEQARLISAALEGTPTEKATN